MALSTNLVSYWKLDEASGNASDSVASSTLSNNSVSYSTGKINNGASFSGSTSSYFNTASVSGLNQTGPRTIAMWVKPNSVTGYCNLWSKSQSSNENGELFIHDGKLRFEARFGGTYQTPEETTASISTGSWKHVVMTYDSSNVKFYVNGSLTYTSSSISGTTPTNTSDLTLGTRRSPSIDSPYNGMIDEVGFWSRALTSTEVTELYNSGAGLSYPFPSPNKSNFFAFF